MELDSVQIGVTDVDKATAAYTLLLGVDPARLAGDIRCFQLGRGAVELMDQDILTAGQAATAPIDACYRGPVPVILRCGQPSSARARAGRRAH